MERAGTFLRGIGRAGAGRARRNAPREGTSGYPMTVWDAHPVAETHEDPGGITSVLVQHAAGYRQSGDTVLRGRVQGACFIAFSRSSTVPNCTPVVARMRHR